MPLVLVNNGEGIALRALVNHTAPQNLSLRLYQNNITPAETDVTATYTLATFTGYASVTLTGASWTITEGAPSQASYAQQSFTSSADQTLQNIYGYYLVQVTSGLLVWSERFTNAPFAISNNGDQIRVTPRITAD
jgi:hypothetical protein